MFHWHPPYHVIRLMGLFAGKWSADSTTGRKGKTEYGDRTTGGEPARFHPWPPVPEIYPKSPLRPIENVYERVVAAPLPGLLVNFAVKPDKRATLALSRGLEG